MSKSKKILDIAVIYARYSSHGQKEASIEQQVEAAKNYAQRKKLSVSKVYADKAVSGKTFNRADFKRLMKDAEKGSFQYVIAWKSNRLGRNMLESMQIEVQLAELGIKVLYVEESFDDTAAGRFALRNMMNVNQFYSESMAEDIKRGMMDNAKQCKSTGHLPFGFRSDKDGNILVHEENAKIVLEAFHRVDNGEMYVDIYEDFNRRGIRTQRGGKWTQSTMIRVLTNERYTGVYIYKDIRTEGGMPKIIDKELYLRVQENIKNRRGNKTPRGSAEYLLTGKLFCGKCKTPMTGISGTGKSGQTHYYYICNKKKTEKACDKQNIRRDETEFAIANAVRDYVLQDDVIEWILDNVEKYQAKGKPREYLNSLEAELSNVQKAIKNIIAAIEQGIITDTTKERLVELESDKSRLAAQLEKEKALIKDVTRDQVLAWLESFREGNIQNRRVQKKLFDAFLIAVYVYDDKYKIVFGFTDGQDSVELPISQIVDTVNENGRAEGVRPDSPRLHQKNKSEIPVYKDPDSDLFFIYWSIQLTK